MANPKQSKELQKEIRHLKQYISKLELALEHNTEVSEEQRDMLMLAEHKIEDMKKERSIVSQYLNIIDRLVK